ncbi:hemerythrin domain-containing protein [Thiospirillum jenense]|uniref:Hemerythrin domain-containing protein n=1 Tax=Thiospirillum jenense TaxID=1653858 RepID=A0A839H713_9GAMM|nr:hemerythrin domain-containing protein [Thiospirillum jenense]MBB1125074.1 hemerythrin domain-containing protein [Thiospirillum jenense]
MQTLVSYRDNHAALRQIIENLNAILTIEQLSIRPNAKIAYQLLCELGRRVLDHLAEEDQQLYPNLLSHTDPKVKSIAWGFISTEKPLRRTFEEYHHRWLKDCNFNFCEEFLEESREILDMLSYRVDREEQVLFPKLVEIGLFTEQRI